MLLPVLLLFVCIALVELRDWYARRFRLDLERRRVQREAVALRADAEACFRRWAARRGATVRAHGTTLVALTSRWCARLSDRDAAVVVLRSGVRSSPLPIWHLYVHALEDLLDEAVERALRLDQRHRMRLGAYR